MFAASALGTNLGDFPVDVLGLNRLVSFACLIGVSLVAISADRASGRRAEAGYWVAIVLLRAAATNVADFLTHDLALGYVLPAVVLAGATLIAGGLTRTGTPARIGDRPSGSPCIDGRYWIAMGLGGIFGTVAGDLASHGAGLYVSAAATGLLLAVGLAVRAWIAPWSILGYWAIVLVERCAGTPFGDMLASHRGLGLGALVAMAFTAPLLAAALLVRRIAEHGIGGNRVAGRRA
jgi:uncharacterized membrane-anchored protein